MSILLTGAAGFIGSHVAVELINAGYNIVCVDNFINSVQGLLQFKTFNCLFQLSFIID